MFSRRRKRLNPSFPQRRHCYQDQPQELVSAQIRIDTCLKQLPSFRGRHITLYEERPDSSGNTRYPVLVGICQRDGHG